MNKYKAVRSSGFHSKLEHSVFDLLSLRQKAGELLILSLQEQVYLTKARIRYIADFKCRDLITGNEFFVEAKGFQSERWPTIKKLWKYYGPAKLEIWRGSYKKPYLDEVIIPE